MRPSVLATFVSLVAASLAMPTAVPWRGHDNKACMNTTVVDEMVAAYVALVSAFTVEVAEKYLAEGFADFSDSINSLAGRAVGEATFATKQAFIQAQAGQSQVPVVVEEVPMVTCNMIAVIWKAVFGAQNPARGISVLETTPVPAKDTGGWQFVRFDVEFNNLVWARNVAVVE